MFVVKGRDRWWQRATTRQIAEAARRLPGMAAAEFAERMRQWVLAMHSPVEVETTPGTFVTVCTNHWGRKPSWPCADVLRLEGGS